MNSRFKGTFGLLGLCTAIQAFSTLYPAHTGWEWFYPHSLEGWVGILTYQICHFSWEHLVGNFMFGLPFMLYYEAVKGSRSLLLRWGVCGVGGALLEMLLGAPVPLIGASGAIFGIATAACVNFGDTVPQRLLGVGLFALMYAQELAAAPYGGITGIAHYYHLGGITGIAHYCHLGGMLTALLLYALEDIIDV